MGRNAGGSIEGSDVSEDLTRKKSILSGMRALKAKDRAGYFRKLGDQYSTALTNLFNNGAAHDAYDYVENGVVIWFTLHEPEIHLKNSFALVKREGRAVVEKGNLGKVDAVCKLTLEAAEYIIQASDYKDVGRRLLECRRYPTKTRALTWKTVIQATAAYENGLFHMYRKFGMY